MAYINYGNAVSCGMRELAELGTYNRAACDPKEHIETVTRYAYEGEDPRFSQILFSDANKEGHGRRLAKYIRENNLGDIVKTKSIRNRNTGNMITSWIWNIRSFRTLCRHVGYKPEKVREISSWY